MCCLVEHLDAAKETTSLWSVEYLEAAALTVAMVVAVYAIRAFNHQAKATDTNSILVLMGYINEAWNEYRLAMEEADEVYFFGQLLSFYETACYLFNKKLLSKRVKGLLADHIVEVMAMFRNDKKALGYFDRVASAPTTFCEIKEFLKKHPKKYTEQVELFTSQLKEHQEQ